MSLDLQKIDVLFEWMLDGARPSADAREIVSGICERLVEAGVPLKRFALFIYTLHPNLLGRRLRWTPDAGVEQTDADLGAFDGAEYRDNPLPTVIATRREVRRRLCDPDCPDDFLILGQFRKEGVTDYLVQPLVFTTGESHAATWATSAKDGFDDSAIAAFGKIRKPLARLTETYMLRLNASNLLSAYVGRDGGHKILSGQVHRGDLEEINAAIVFADLVGFTAFSNNEPADAVLDRLNQFHDAFVPHIVDHDGELLKFMGDGVLAIFPVDLHGSKEAACRAAVAALDAASERTDDVTPDFRASVHFGPVQYGNIGSVNRLDFTAIGPAVNLAARLLSNAAFVNGQTVVSEQVARLLDLEGTRSADLKLKGFGSAQKIVVLHDMITPEI